MSKTKGKKAEYVGDQLAAIKQMLLEGMSTRNIQKLTGASKSTVSRIKLNQRVCDKEPVTDGV